MVTMVHTQTKDRSELSAEDERKDDVSRDFSMAVHDRNFALAKELYEEIITFQDSE